MRVINKAIMLGALLATVPVMAQGKVSVNGSVVGALDGLKKVTNSNVGFTLGAGYENVIESVKLPWRVSLNGYMFGGKEKNGLKSTLNSVQVAGDVFVSTPIESLRFLTGLTLNKYMLTNKGDIRDAGGNLVAEFPVDTDKGLKLGVRAGFEMAFTKNLSSEIMLQVTELGSSPSAIKAEGKSGSGLGQGGVNPSWIEIGVRYTF